ncbi:hypothetical protein MHZ95_18045 [Sporosarcina sp. ACRSM]|uniref:DUF4760 domain-containing protein n=1 Tax=Sporosarcina sp. ACRSM TaxID=2918216 RepID=UPI001EF4E6C0|nr:hypothetical protein [Sporosarcina sp. ACRSM]MCG7337164.1 hypothetical protein [Sporosarcina sp. ACRSM]
MNRRIIAYAFISLSLLLSVLFYGDALKGIFSKIQLATIVGMSAIASGVTGVVMSLASKRVANFEAIREYFQQGDTQEMIQNRGKIYDLENEKGNIDQTAAAEICGFFHFWGMMVSKGYLPIWIFKSSSGYSVVKLFYLLQPYIQERRMTTNKYYAEGFEQLAKKIKKKYKYEYLLEERRGEKEIE